MPMYDMQIYVMDEKTEVKWVSEQTCGGPQKQQTPWWTEWGVDLLHGNASEGPPLVSSSCSSHIIW